MQNTHDSQTHRSPSSSLGSVAVPVPVIVQIAVCDSLNLNIWKNILVVVVAADRPLDHHVLCALNFGRRHMPGS